MKKSNAIIHWIIIPLIILGGLSLTGIGFTDKPKESSMNIRNDQLDIATFAGGCFWCIESAFEELDGVINAISGYTGGHTEHPSYKQVTSGTTGHFEAVQVTFNPKIISFQELVRIFFQQIDPTD